MTSSSLDKKRLHYTMNIFMVLIVIVSILMTFLESIDSIMTPELRGIFLSIHLTILIIFFAEFLYRFWSSPQRSKYTTPTKARLFFLLHPLTIIDIIVLVPLFMMIWTHDLHNANLVILRLLRFTSVLNIFRFYRSSRVLALLRALSRDVWYEILVFFIISVQCIIIAGVLFYSAEYGINPGIKSIGDGIWWSTVTMATIGYGDVYPMTVFGRIIASFLAFFGIGLIALPTGILASGFMKALREEKKLEEFTEEIEEESDDINARLRRIEKRLSNLKV